MTLLAPWALGLLAVGAAVVALYLLRIKRRRETVPALDFWLRLAGKTRVHSLFDRLKRLLSMLLWLAVVAALALAVANPILSLGRVKPRAIAVILQNSAAMQAVEPELGGMSRLDLAREALRDLTTRRPVTDEWLLIEAAREPTVLQPWTYDAKSLRAAAGKLAPFPGSTDLPAAVALAGQLLAGRPDPCIVVISPGAGGEVARLASDDARIVPWPVGRTTDNLGVARLAVRPSRQGGQYHALVSVVSASTERIDTQLVLTVDGRTYSVEPLAIEPGGIWERTLVIDPPTGFTGGTLRAAIDRPDALSLDNEAYAVLPPVRPAAVWLVTPARGRFFFEQALGQMDPLVSAEDSLTLTPEQYPAALASLLPGVDGKRTVRVPDLIVFNNWAPPALPASGRFVLVNAWPMEIPLDTAAGEPAASGAAAVAAALTSPQVFLSARPHPLTQHLALQGAKLARAKKVTPRAPVTVLAHTAPGDPLMVLTEGWTRTPAAPAAANGAAPAVHAGSGEGGPATAPADLGDRRALILAFDVLESDLPFRNAFPLLLRNAVAFMHQDAPPLVRPEARIGEPIASERPLPPGVTTVTVTFAGVASTPAARAQPVPAPAQIPVNSGRFTYPGTLRPGVVAFALGAETASTALSVADARESRLAPMTAPDPAAALQLSRSVFGSLPWFALALMATVAVALEWLTYHRRWTE